MLNQKTMLLAPGLLLGVMAVAAETAAPSGGAFQPDPLTGTRAEVREHVGKQALLFETTEMVKSANNLMNTGKYRDAIKSYRAVIKKLAAVSGGSAFREKIDFCRRRISECYYNMADEAMKKADELATSYDFEEAVKLCREAQEYCPERREELAERIVFYEKRRDRAAERESVTPSKILPNLDAQNYQIQLLLEQGISLARRNEFAQARRKFEEVLLIDPYNEEATQNMLGIATRLRKAAVARANATARHLAGEVEWTGAIPIVPEAPVGTPENQLGAPVQKSGESPMEKRLKSIVIPDFALYDKLQTFAEAMDELTRLAEEHDPQHRGINFVIRNKSYPNPKSAPKLAGYSPSKASVYDILTTLRDRGDLTFRLDKNAVIIAAKGVELEKMTVEQVPFVPEAEETEEKLKEALTAAAGVEFAPGSSLTLVPVRNEVISRNTPENQRKIEAWLAKNGVISQPMVQIMFKFLEVAQNDLDELGFNWQYSRTGNRAAFSSNPLLRHYQLDEKANDRYEGVPASGNTTEATYNFEWSDRKNSLTASVYLLDWADSSDILYSPRVTTLAGTTASVNMTAKHYYPDEYEDIDNEETTRQRVYVYMPQPTFDDDGEDLGIKFDIKPEVKNRQITAPVKFTIRQFDSWLVVDSRNLDDPDDDGEYQKKAVFTNRTLNTKVTLDDGKTVLIGSISQDVTTSIHDKIPILGDIPFLGRFFQSKYTSSKKNVLLVFMTCKLVNPDGSAVYPEDIENTGVPEFSRNI